MQAIAAACMADALSGEVCVGAGALCLKTAHAVLHLHVIRLQ